MEENNEREIDLSRREGNLVLEAIYTEVNFLKNKLWVPGTERIIKQYNILEKRLKEELK